MSLVYTLLIREVFQEEGMSQQSKKEMFVIYKSNGMGVTDSETKLCLNFDEDLKL